MIILFVFYKVYPKMFEISPHRLPLPSGERGEGGELEDMDLGTSNTLAV